MCCVPWGRTFSAVASIQSESLRSRLLRDESLLGPHCCAPGNDFRNGYAEQPQQQYPAEPHI
eukprot:6202873-Pleurochrysis_carterae.AAC.3